jgi:hypothetical protein
LRDTAYEKLLPPLLAKVRDGVTAWRAAGYAGASATSRALLTWWFETDQLLERADGTQSLFRYYFAQREAVESVIWLYEVRRARDKFDLLRFDSSGAVSLNMFDENWPRYVVKMATGAGKTKVLSLLIAWSFFHKLYEGDSMLARNFLLIAPNIIVLDRLRMDFDGLRIFFNDPVLPENGYRGQNWRDDFQVALHIQDEVRIVRPTGNIFLTNIHRVYLGDVREPSLERRAERRGPSCALGLGVVSKKYALTAPYYIYYIAFRSHDIPKLRASHWIPSFPHSAREIWVKQRQIRDLLLANRQSRARAFAAGGLCSAGRGLRRAWLPQA